VLTLVVIPQQCAYILFLTASQVLTAQLPTNCFAHAATTDRCDIAVHQQCYGVRTIPQHDYFCHPCAAHIAAGGKDRKVYTVTRKGLHHLQCVLCSERAPRGGAFTSTDIGSDAWVHVVCARWLSQQHSSIKLDNHSYKVQCAQFLQERKSPVGVCLFCRQSEGGLLRCMTEGCQTRFHVSCARESSRCVMDSLTHRKEPARWRALCPHHVSSKDTERMRSSLLLSLKQNEVDDEQESSSIAAAAAAAAAVGGSKGAAAAGGSGSGAAKSKGKAAGNKRANGRKSGGGGDSSSSSGAPVSRKH
jgi:uncharacterized membrane protein YgcG